MKIKAKEAFQRCGTPYFIGHLTLKRAWTLQMDSTDPIFTYSPRAATYLAAG